MNCQLLNSEKMVGYDSNLPDIVLDKTGNLFKKTIKVSTTIKEIESIEEVKSMFTTTFVLKVEWVDARLTWYDLNDELDLNIPSKVHKKSIWFPKLKLQIRKAIQRFQMIPNQKYV